MEYPQTSYVHTRFPSPSFIRRRREVIYENTLLYQLNVLKETGRYDAFKLDWHPSYDDQPNVWPVPNHLFWDSDVAKWIEGACYFLQWKRNPQISAAVEELVGMIRSAQQPDGYLNIHFTVVEPEKRFSNLRDLHELYNAGHLIEAALAHCQVYGNDLLLGPVVKYVELLSNTFGPGQGQRHGYPGHPEIELALLRLFDKTKDPKHFALAAYFLNERGNESGQDGRHYYDVESNERGESEHTRPAYWPSPRCYWYQQAHKPIAEQETIEGHSVRAMYLLTAVADLVRLDTSRSSPLQKALERLWTNMIERKMYLTGGIGAQKQWEGFGIDYFLPSGTDEGGCYAETCAGIGVMMLAERLLHASIDLNAEYADIMELCFYNAVTTGMSASGTRFTYINQLASTDTDLSKRAEWFTCACCPPNVTRLMGYIGGYLWTCIVREAKSAVQINVHMYSAAALNIPIQGSTVSLEQKSQYPWDGSIEFVLQQPSNISVDIRLRIPGWANEWKVTPAPPSKVLEKGYLTLPHVWLQQTPEFRLTIALKPRLITPHPYSNQDIVALARGPVVYCLEDVDNDWVDDHFKSLEFDSSGQITEDLRSDSEMGEPYVALTAHNAASFLRLGHDANPAIPIESAGHQQRSGANLLHFIPYCLRDNRGGKGHMRVGLRRKH